MPRSTDWTRNETLAAFHIYLQLPFGQLHRNQPRIVQLSQWMGRTASAVAMKLVNLASLDPQIVASGRRGMGNASKLDQQIWNEFLAANDPVVTEAATSCLTSTILTARRQLSWPVEAGDEFNPLFA